MGASESTTSMAYAIKETFDPEVHEGLFRNDQVVPTLAAYGMKMITAPGGDYVQWHMNSTGNTSAAIFTENDPAPASVAQAYIRPKVGYTYFWVWVTLTGIGRDAVRNGNFDAVRAAVEGSMGDVIDLRSTTYLGASSNGLGVAIDSTTTYAGITRGSAAYFESTESSTNTLAGLRAANRACRDADKAGRPSLHLVSPTILEWYSNLGGTYVAATGGNGNLRMTQMADGTPYRADFGIATSGFSFNGAPVVELPDVTSTEWFGLDMRYLEHHTIRGLNVQFHSNVGDNELYKITVGSTLVYKEPKRAFKMTGLS